MKIIIAIATLLISSAACAQGDTSPAKQTNTRVEQDTIILGKAKVILLNDENDSTDVAWEDKERDTKLENTHWAGLDIGVNLLVNKNNKTDLGSDNKWLEQDYARSLSFRFNLVEQKIRLYKDYVGILVGGGISYNSYGLKNNVEVVSNSEEAPDSTFGVFVPDTLRNFTKNKLRVAYLHIPLMLEFNTSIDPEKSFHIAAGIIGGWKIGSMTKQKFDQDDSAVKLAVRDDFNLTPFTLDLSARIGYKNFTLFATYGITPLFQNNRGAEIYPVTLGLSFIPFG